MNCHSSNKQSCFDMLIIMYRVTLERLKNKANLCFETKTVAYQKNSVY